MARKLKTGNPNVKEDRNAPEKYLVNMMSWEEELEGRRRPYASTVAYCPRQNYHFALPQDEMNVFGPESVAYMGFGIGFEDFLYRRMVEEGKAFLSNPYLPHISDEWEGIDVGGRIDIVGWDHKDELAIWEVKTCGKLPTEPKLNHLRQIQTYAILGGFDNAYLIYQSRDVMDWRIKELKFRVFTVDTSREALLDVTAQIFYTFASLDGGWLPSKPSSFRKSTECRYCPFKDECWGAEWAGIHEPLPLEDDLEEKQIARKKAEEYFDWRPNALRRFLERDLHLIEEPHYSKLQKLLD